MNKTCSHCNSEKPIDQFYKHANSKDGFRQECKDCTKSANSKWSMDNKKLRAKYSLDHYYRNRQECLAKNKRWREGNPDKVRLCDRSWVERNRATKYEHVKRSFARNRAKRMAKLREWQKAHPDKVSLYAKRSYKNSVERKANYQRSYRQANRDRTVMQVRNRRARIAGAEGCTSPKEWAEIKNRYKHRCLWCGRFEPNIKLTPDHVVPTVMGGSNWPHNIQPLCGRCNSRKGAKYMEFRPDRMISDRCA
jgi:hypothetical protein